MPLVAPPASAAGLIHLAVRFAGCFHHGDQGVGPHERCFHKRGPCHGFSRGIRRIRSCGYAGVGCCPARRCCVCDRKDPREVPGWQAQLRAMLCQDDEHAGTSRGVVPRSTPRKLTVAFACTVCGALLPLHRMEHRFGPNLRLVARDAIRDVRGVHAGKLPKRPAVVAIIMT